MTEVKKGEILRQLLTDDQVVSEVKTTYQHVLDLCSKKQETCELVKSELASSQQKNKIQFDKKTKHRMLTVGSFVLLMRSTMQTHYNTNGWSMHCNKNHRFFRLRNQIKRWETQNISYQYVERIFYERITQS